MTLNVDYVSDLHLGFYIKDLNSTEEINKFVIDKIKPKVKSSVLVIFGSKVYFKKRIRTKLPPEESSYLRNIKKTYPHHNDVLSLFFIP